MADVTFELPGGWAQSSTQAGGINTWTPKDNERGESIVVVRADAPTEIVENPSQLSEVLQEAQGTLTDEHVAAVPVRTSGGMIGTRVDVDYVPTGTKTRYHRVHVVLLDGTQLVHVLYTARSSDPNLSALKSLLQTVRHA